MTGRIGMLLAGAAVGAVALYFVLRGKPADGADDLTARSTDDYSAGITAAGSARPPPSSPTLALGRGPQATLAVSGPPLRAGYAPVNLIGAGPIGSAPRISPVIQGSQGGPTTDTTGTVPGYMVGQGGPIAGPANNYGSPSGPVMRAGMFP